MKRLDTSIEEAVKHFLLGTFQGGTCVGTLANGGVAMVGSSNLMSDVPNSLRLELEDVRQGIIVDSIPTLL